jgi:hypothetical protein
VFHKHDEIVEMFFSCSEELKTQKILVEIAVFRLALKPGTSGTLRTAGPSTSTETGNLRNVKNSRSFDQH